MEENLKYCRLDKRCMLLILYTEYKVVIMLNSVWAEKESWGAHCDVFWEILYELKHSKCTCVNGEIHINETPICVYVYLIIQYICGVK